MAIQGKPCSLYKSNAEDTKRTGERARAVEKGRIGRRHRERTHREREREREKEGRIERREDDRKAGEGEVRAGNSQDGGTACEEESAEATERREEGKGAGLRRWEGMRRVLLRGGSREGVRWDCYAVI